MRILSYCVIAGLTVTSQIFAFQAPTPEPSTMLLLGVGLAGIGVVAWRKNHKK